ncbi:MAG: AraC family transcriptional regulator [Christensenella sp.]|uniref:AraC family transcriptional regulator n=1 Tax=Christensenella sp. TaxID=1935934 RepID=UPI002B218E20|nr:AraC family transcriptional regulator [Christensenella sp.]MEA5003659.1 AraC family transcriptional regulator [Christensenella sp.]
MAITLFHGDLVKSNRIIYTPSAFAKANLIHLQETGELQAQQPHSSKRKGLFSYLFFVVLHGSGTLKYDGSVYSLTVGDCVFIDCRKPYAHCSSNDLWTLKWAHFYGPNMNAIYEKYMERGGQPCFHAHTLDQYHQILEQIYEIASSADYIRDMKIYEHLASLLTLLMEEGWDPLRNSFSTTKKQNLQNIKEYLDQHYQEKISLDMLADLFYVNKFYLTRVFKEQFGLSVNNYLLHVRINRAKQFLRFTTSSIEEISHACGMTDANYFSRIFKRLEGISPGEFRKRW